MAIRKLSLGLVLAALGALPAQAATSDYAVGFGPYVGGGATSSGAKVRSTSGYSLSVERGWQLTDSGMGLGPLLEVSNGFINTRQDQNGTRQIATYDNRIFAAGFRLSQSLGDGGALAQGVYFAAVAGRGYSKLAVDATTDRTYTQNLYGNIYGDYFGGELGAWIPLKGNFGINLALLGNIYKANQSDATYTYQGNQVAQDGTLSLREGASTAADGTLAKTIDLKTYAAKVGLSLGF